MTRVPLVLTRISHPTVRSAPGALISGGVRPECLQPGASQFLSGSTGVKASQVWQTWVICGLACLSVFLLGLLPARAQSATSNPAEGDDPIVQFQAVNADLPTILQEYEQLTGKTLIEDSNLLTNAAPITISVPDQVRRSQVIRLIEAAREAYQRTELDHDTDSPCSTNRLSLRRLKSLNED